MPNWKLAAAVTGGALLAVSTAKAQRTVITVGGANPSFSNLPAAVAAAAPGSVLVVRPGTHDGFTTNKPLRVVLDFTAQTGSIVAPAGATYAIEVSGLSGNQEFALVGRGARIHGGALGGIRVSNTAGRVVF
ncbi:MAG: hypothetical protein KDE27_22750, partial [Planctomycetes bacterium]|nr:hypothetical protein [Planctomycetota bacterium]